MPTPSSTGAHSPAKIRAVTWNGNNKIIWPYTYGRIYALVPAIRYRVQQPTQRMFDLISDTAFANANADVFRRLALTVAAIQCRWWWLASRLEEAGRNARLPQCFSEATIRTMRSCRPDGVVYNRKVATITCRHNHICPFCHHRKLRKVAARARELKSAYPYSTYIEVHTTGHAFSLPAQFGLLNQTIKSQLAKKQLKAACIWRRFVARTLASGERQDDPTAVILGFSNQATTHAMTTESIQKYGIVIREQVNNSNIGVYLGDLLDYEADLLNATLFQQNPFPVLNRLICANQLRQTTQGGW